MLSYKIEIIRCTVFTDRLFPFSIEIAQKFISFLEIENLVPVILPNEMIPDAGMTSWGLISDNKSFLEVHENRIDFFSFDLKEVEATNSFCLLFKKVIQEFPFKVRRIAFAPIYSIDANSYFDVTTKNTSKSRFSDVTYQNYQTNKVFFIPEIINGVPVTMIYNGIIALKDDLTSIGANKIVNLIIDINTQDTGEQIFSLNSVNSFFSKVPVLTNEFVNFLESEK